MSDSDILAPVHNVSVIASELEEADGLGTGLPGPQAPGRLKSRVPASFWQRAFSFPALLGSLLVGAMAIVARTFFVDPDVWWHIKQGESILNTGHLPTTDIYSLTLTGRPWAAYEWLGDVLLATAYRAAGMRGLETLLIILGSAILIALYVLATIRSGKSKAAFVATALVFVLAIPSFNLRPQMLGYLFLVVTLIILERFKQGHCRSLWALPLLMLLWVNAHGSWIIGLAVIAVYFTSGLLEFRMGEIESRRWSPAERTQLGIVLVLCACASVITPYGVALAKYPFDVAFSLPVGVANVLEWQPMAFASPLGRLFLVAVIGVIFLQVIHRLAWRLEDFSLFLIATVMACLHIRFIMIFVPVFTPILATIVARWVPRYDQLKDRTLMNAAVMAAIAAVILWYFPTQADLLKNAGNKYPVAAVEYLNSHAVPGPMYNSYVFGGYLILSRGPEHKVFVDGRSELYERGGFLEDYLEISNVRPAALSVLQKYGIKSCLLEHDEPMATVLAALPNWQKAYEDRTSILFVRSETLAEAPKVSGPHAPSLEERP